MLAVLCLLPVLGCSTIKPENLTPASEVLNASCCRPDTEVQINFLTLRQAPPTDYVLDSGDVLGIYIQGITGEKDEPPPVHFPTDESMQPGLGYPVPIRDDGFISLPLVAPIRVSGLTMAEAERKILEAYTKDRKILLEGSEKIIVTLMRRRTYNVLVIREDINDDRQVTLNQNQVYLGESNSGETFSLDLPAYENDVLHALSETGGMPTENALNEIVILRGGNQHADHNSLVHAVDEFGSPIEPHVEGEGGTVIRIPVRGEPGTFPNLTDADITLETGDVVYIEGRDRDIFYTGGLLDGGRFPIPRDYDIDVMEAISLSGGVSSATGGGRSAALLPPTQVTVLRKCGCEQVAIDVDLRYVYANPAERVIIQPGDLIVLEYRNRERLLNSVISLFQYGGITNLISN